MKLVTGLLLCTFAHAHDVITTPITWSREILRIVYNKCASCHRPGGSAFSLITYEEARPWVVAIREETLRRTMPPWGAVKGFGDFRNDQALTPEEIDRLMNELREMMDKFMSALMQELQDRGELMEMDPNQQYADMQDLQKMLDQIQEMMRTERLVHDEHIQRHAISPSNRLSPVAGRI